VHDPSAPWVRVAASVRVRGAKGFLSARLAPGSPNPFRAGQTLRFARHGSADERRLETVEHYRDRVVLSLSGVTDPALLQPLVGSDIYLQSKDLVDLPEGTYYIFRLVGLEVRAAGNRLLGKVVEVLPTGGTDVLRVQGEGDREFLIPFARTICTRVDLVAGCIEVDPPEGLLDIDAI
jgi:16S rRNA processing protein RimM